MRSEEDSPAQGRTGSEHDQSPGEGVVPTRKAYSIAVLNRAIDILEVFSPTRPSLGLKEIVRETGLPKTTTFRILSSLVERGFCELDPQSGEYSLGFVFLKYSELRRRQTSFHGPALHVLRRIRDEVDETVALTVRAGDFRVHIDSFETRQQLKRTVAIGEPAPLYIGASGKILLAGLEDEEVESYLSRAELVKIQESTITEPQAIWKEIRTIRAQGYAESRGELITGGGSLAAPLRDYSGKTIAAIDILTPEQRYTDAHRERCIRLLLHETLEASQSLGYRP